MEPLFYSKTDAAKMLGCSTRFLDYARASGKIRARRLGRRVMFSLEELRRFSSRDQASVAPSPSPESKTP